MFPLFAIAAAGYAYGRARRPDMGLANQLNMDVFIPALVFAALASKNFEFASSKGLALGALIVMFGSGLVGWLMARSSKTRPVATVLPMMFNNCGNLGLPLSVLAFGDRALAPAVVLFAISNFLHFSLGLYLVDHHARLMNLWRMPVTLATFAGLAVAILNIEIWPPLMLAIRMLGDISVPLLLFSLGIRLTDASRSSWRAGLAVAIARPLCGFALAWIAAWLLDLDPLQRGLLLVFGALPPAVLNFVFAERYRLEPEKMASMVLVGNLAALVFIPLALVLALR